MSGRRRSSRPTPAGPAMTPTGNSYKHLPCRTAFTGNHLPIYFLFDRFPTFAAGGPLF